ncbi:hypothetical protein [Paenibacillus elgii]|uniref:hypothetical protein n=1 Tax=Paenibacillus elgii TaxID=189691 RepID=UPI000A947F40|nr:hypothetical protein [Paenibacillus elgii]
MPVQACIKKRPSSHTSVEVTPMVSKNDSDEEIYIFNNEAINDVRPDATGELGSSKQTDGSETPKNEPNEQV